ncbi:MAG TPA: prolyl oligopeptidase family serine peptidase [Streptosporangiaceae bacterium]|nr:prolyl oligopeptidase family serine peptidase [Streptosporangiaceae bacterium]
MPVIDAAPPPLVSLSPAGAYVVLVHGVTHPPIATLARPYLPLAGLRVDPVLRARRRVRANTAVSVVSVADARECFLDTPEGALVGLPAWAPDGQRFAFTVDGADGVGVWVADAGSGDAHPLTGLTVCDVLAGDPSPGGGVVTWSRDGNSLLLLATPAEPPVPPPPDPEPRVQETAGQRSQAATYQDLLRTHADEDLFEALATSVPCRVDPTTGKRTELGPGGLYHRVSESADGRYLLVQSLRRPFSFRVPWFWFARRSEVWDATGTPLAVVADLPASEEVPRQGVPEGPRMVSWEERAPAALAWVEALDGGDPTRPAEHRDRVFRLAAPFGTAPSHAFDVRQRCHGWWDLDEPHQVVMVEYDRDRRWQTTWLCDLAAPEHNRVLFDRSVDDAYADPGAPLVTLKADGSWTAIRDGNAIYLRGEGATPAGKRPFLDRFDLSTLLTTRLHQSTPGRVERVLGFTSRNGKEVVQWRESPTDPPNLHAVMLDGTGSRELTHWPHPYPQFSGITRRLVTHDRGDGVPLSGLLYLPPGHDPDTDGRLPLVIWAYPLDYGNAQTAGQVRAGTGEFVRLSALGPVLFVLGGYAVLADATMPVVGDPETMNDTYVEQVTAAARAHIKALDEAGVIDPTRVAVGGHSYGGFMTVNLLAHTEDFAAGIARSGAYNRTLTPFGFQTERRNFWEATAVYDQVSPFRFCDQIKTPLLLVHGEQDDNPGTFPIQSERMFQAIQGNGGTARLVMLPHEDHGYNARESVMHVVAEEFAWLGRWLGPVCGDSDAKMPA